MKIFDFFKKIKTWQKIIFTIILIIILMLVFGKKNNKNERKFSDVQRIDLAQIISVTGRVEPIKNIDTAFKTSGIIGNVSVKVGDSVKAGQILANLENSSLLAQKKQAQAQLDGQNAKLAELKLGSKLEDVAVSSSSLEKAKLDLSNYSQSVFVTINEAYNISNNILRENLTALFEYSPGAIDKYVLSYHPCDANTANSLSDNREIVDDKLFAWQKDIQDYSQWMQNNPVYTEYKEERVQELISKSISYMSYFDLFLNDINKTLVLNCNLSPTETGYVNTFKSYVPGYITTFNTEFGTIKTSKQNLDAYQATVKNYQNQLDLKKSGGTPEQIAYQESQIKSAQANLELINSQINDTYIIAPIDGIITIVSIDSGEVATAGKNYISLISSDPFQIESYVNETDVAKIALDNEADITFDAFGQAKQYHGKIVKIDPAQTIVEGVVSYKTTFSIADFNDDIKPGMTANIDIITAKKSNILSIPTRAISKKQGKAFVSILEDGKEKELEIKIGIKGDNGYTEVLEGLEEGQKILLN